MIQGLGSFHVFYFWFKGPIREEVMILQEHERSC